MDKNGVTFHERYVQWGTKHQSVQLSDTNIIQDKQKQIAILQQQIQQMKQHEMSFNDLDGLRNFEAAETLSELGQDHFFHGINVADDKMDDNHSFSNTYDGVSSNVVTVVCLS